MKNFYSYLYILITLIVVSSCSDDDVVVRDTDGNVIDTSNSVSTIANVDVNAVTDYTVNFDLSLDDQGSAYYVIQETSLGALSSNNVVADGTEVEFTTDGTKTIDVSALESNTSYTIYVGTTNNLSVRSEAVATAEFTTPDTVDPFFIPGDSTPATGSVDNDPTNTTITLAFSETVRYTGRPIVVIDFFAGLEYIVTDAELVQDGSSEVVIDVPVDYFQQGEGVNGAGAIVVQFPEGTFVDQADKEVPAQRDFSYFFRNGAYDLSFIVETFYQNGVYDYTGSAVALPIDAPGTFEVLTELNDNGEYTTTLYNAVDGAVTNDFENFTVRFGEDDEDGAVDGIGYLYMDGPVTSIYTAGEPLYWVSNLNGESFLNRVGTYNIDDRSIELEVRLTDGTGSATFDLADYRYTPQE